MASGGPLFFDLWGVPFVLVGLYMIVGRFFYEAMLRSRTYYGVTNERVIIISGLSSRTVKSLQVQTLTDVSLSEEASGTGTVTFGPNILFGQRVERGSKPATVVRVDCRRTGSVRTDLLGPEGSVKREIGRGLLS